MGKAVKLQSGSNCVPRICEVAKLPSMPPHCPHKAFSKHSICMVLGIWDTSGTSTRDYWITQFFSTTDAVRYMTSATVMPCNMTHAGQSWTTLTLRSMPIIVTKPLRQSPARVSDDLITFQMKRFTEWTMVGSSNSIYCCISFLSLSGNNSECEMFICECDRKAAECFAVSGYNEENKHLPSDRCK